MAQATRLNPDSSRGFLGVANIPSLSDDAQLRETLRYCSASTYEAARQFRATARTEYVPAILQGILLHYVEAGLRPQLWTRADGLRLQEDLGLDSLTLMEIMIRLEDVLQISVRDDELRQFRTLGEVRALIERTLASGNPASPSSGAAPA